jgi:hypothetical protein
MYVDVIRFEGRTLRYTTSPHDRWHEVRCLRHGNHEQQAKAGHKRM